MKKSKEQKKKTPFFKFEGIGDTFIGKFKNFQLNPPKGKFGEQLLIVCDTGLVSCTTDLVNKVRKYSANKFKVNDKIEIELIKVVESQKKSRGDFKEYRFSVNGKEIISDSLFKPASVSEVEKFLSASK